MPKKVVPVVDLRESLMNFVANRQFFKIRLNHGGWSGNVYMPLYIESVCNLSKDNVIVYQDVVTDEWKVGTVKVITATDHTVNVQEIRRKGVTGGYATVSLEISNIVCRLKKIYGKSK